MLFDTDVIIWALRGNANAAETIDSADRRCLSSVSYMELVKGSRNKREMQMIKTFLHDLSFEMLAINEAVSHRAVIYMEEFALSGGLELADALIAATAAENGLTLQSGNAKHYRIIPDLDLSVFRREKSRNTPPT